MCREIALCVDANFGLRQSDTTKCNANRVCFATPSGPGSCSIYRVVPDLPAARYIFHAVVRTHTRSNTVVKDHATHHATQHNIVPMYRPITLFCSLCVVSHVLCNGFVSACCTRPSTCQTTYISYFMCSVRLSLQTK